MRKRNKILIFCLTGLLIISSVWFYFFFLEENITSFEEKLITAGQESEVVLIFNSGGWGTTPFENAMDFNPIINEIKELIENQGFRVSIVEKEVRTLEDKKMFLMFYGEGLNQVCHYNLAPLSYMP
jgi:Fe-S cluster assembly iron-binding protein IscA